VDRNALSRELGLSGDDLLIVAGSTHEGEEEVVVEAFKELAAEFPKLRLLIAPRHIERVEDIENLIRRSGLENARVSKLSEMQNMKYERRIMILDTIGRLNEVYSAAAIVFIGGSLVKHGGQNPLEPAVLGRAIIFGPHMFNFRYIAKVLLKEGAALQVTCKEDLMRELRMLIGDPAKRFELGENAKRAIERNRGASDKNLRKISEILG
jgi:3-deoxy-D-manno-octulosonic-acid transferase